MRFLEKRITLLVLPLLGMFLYGTPSFGDEFCPNCGWIVELQLQDDGGYLPQAGWTMKPYTRVLVRYRIKGDDGNWKANVNYEELTYGSGVPIGSHKLNQLKLKEGKPGIFRVLNAATTASGFDVSTGKTIVDAVLRILVDANLKGTSPMSIVVPAIAFQEVITAFHEYRFVPAAPAAADIPTGVVFNIELQSDPLGQSQILSYSGSAF